MALKGVSWVYQHRGFSITLIHADSEFEPLCKYFPQLQTADADDHVPGIEWYIRSMKDRVRSGFWMLPFSHVPWIILTHLDRNVVFWVNAFPSMQGGLGDNLLQYIMVGDPLHTRHMCSVSLDNTLKHMKNTTIVWMSG